MLDTYGLIRLVDFGLSRILEPGDTAKTRCGTMGYIAPEVILKIGHDFQADIWSFGAILCEMLGGFSPFYHDDP
jgi:serine/threonine protein kinase